MLTLYFVRHGETDWNVENRVQGQCDSTLTEKGIQDVLNLRLSLAEMDWLSVYSSPSGRALQTAELLIEGERIQEDDRIKEMNLGIFEGMTWDEIKRYDNRAYDNYWKDPSAFSVRLGETFYDVKKRVTHFLHDISKQFSEGNVLIITHGVIIKIVQVIIHSNSIDNLWTTAHVEGATVTTVNIDQTSKQRIQKR